MKRNHYNITVTGRVQGVFYRKSTQHKAQELHLAGYVQNQPDGSVFIEAEGDTSALDALVEWCKQGPELASVTDVQVSEGEMQNFSTFEIR